MGGTKLKEKIYLFASMKLKPSKPNSMDIESLLKGIYWLQFIS